MKKVALLAGAIAVLGLSATALRAEVCYKLDSFIDVLRLDIEMNDDLTGRSHQAVYGSWVTSPGSRAFAVSGARELVAGSSTIRHLAIVGPDVSTTPMRLCYLDGVPAGAWKVACSDGVATVGTTMARVNCTPQPISGPMAGKSATSR